MPDHAETGTSSHSLDFEQVPPLEPGDRLTRSEFERRYEAMPGLKKAELVEGVVHMPSPVRYRRHGRPHAMLIGWLIQYEAATPGVETADNSTARLDLDNEPQPDAMLLIDPRKGGQARISQDDYIQSAPELVAEVASSSASFDLNGQVARLPAQRRSRVHRMARAGSRRSTGSILREGDVSAHPARQTTDCSAAKSFPVSGWIAGCLDPRRSARRAGRRPAGDDEPRSRGFRPTIELDRSRMRRIGRHRPGRDAIPDRDVVADANRPTRKSGRGIKKRRRHAPPASRGPARACRPAWTGRSA